MEFPTEIKQYILSYLPCLYKKTLHVNAINNTPLFADLTIDRLMTHEVLQEVDVDVDFIWMNSFIEY